MNNYTASFDRYDFTNNQTKIIFKHATLKHNSEETIEEIYMNALKVPYLIGELNYQDSVEFKCTSIEDSQVMNPVEIKKR